MLKLVIRALRYAAADRGFDLSDVEKATLRKIADDMEKYL
jgi:hypothetical protein